MQRLIKPCILGVSPLFLASFFIVAYLFRTHPKWDLGFSAIFYDGSFKLDVGWLKWLNTTGIIVIGYITAGFMAVFIVVSFVIKKETIFGISRKAVIYMAVVLILGPGILVNSILKEQVGRARPLKITCFGGELAFSPAFTQSNECKTNCSFVSGHAAFGFFWVTLGFIARNPIKRRLGYMAGVGFGSIIGLGRIMHGRHFLSDVVFAFYFVFMTAALTYWIWQHFRKSTL